VQEIEFYQKLVDVMQELGMMVFQLTVNLVMITSVKNVKTQQLNVLFVKMEEIQSQIAHVLMELMMT